MVANPQVDAESLRDFLHDYFDPMPGVMVIAHMKPIQKNGKTLSVPVSEFFTGEDRVKYAVQHVVDVDEVNQPESIYFTLETLAAVPEKGRGKAEAAFAWRCLRVDIDIKGPGHKTGNVVDDEDAARKVVADAGLPGPTYWIHSGGGLHGYWFFPPEEISVRGHDWCEGLAMAWAERLTQAGNCDDIASMASFLRLPGTVNRKTKDTKVVEVREGPGQTFTVEELAEYIGYQGPPERTVPPEWNGEVKTGSPCDVLAGVDWGWILEPFGWNLADADKNELVWDRPDGSQGGRSAVVYADQPNVLVNYSDASGLPKGKGRKLTKCKVLAKLGYGGRLDRLAGDINDYVTGGERTKIAEVWKDYPQALKLLREKVTPMGVQANDDDTETTEGQNDGLRLVFGDNQMQAASWMWDETRDGVAGYLGGNAKLLPRSELCLLAGREGLGKSTMACHIAAKVSTGTLPGEFFGKPRSVVYHTTEDHWNVTVVPRLTAAGADINRIAHVEAGPEGFNFPDDIPQLGELCEQDQVALIVLDPLSTLIRGDLNTWKDSDARKALEPLTKMAHDRDVTVLGLAHFKKGEGDALDKVMGTKAFVAVARSVLAVAEEPPTEGEEPSFLFGQIKNNLGPIARHARRYAITSVALGEDQGKPINTSKIVWGAMTDHDIKQVIADANQKAKDKKVNVRDRATEWLVTRLQGGPVPKKTLVAEAKTLGISEITLQRARDNLPDQIKTVQLGGRGKPVAWEWIMPTTEPEWD